MNPQNIEKIKIAKSKKLTEKILRINFEKFVAKRYGIYKENGMHIFNGLCPFHDDKKVGSAYLYREYNKDYYVCKSPGCQANKRKNIIDFVMKKEKLKFYEAREVLKNYLNLSRDLESYKRFKPLNSEDKEHIHNVYNVIKKHLVLEESDESILKSKGRFYRKSDVRTWDSKKALECAKKEFTKEELLRVPGFYLENNELKIMRADYRIAIFVKNTKNQIITVQLRARIELDNVARYITLSSPEELKPNMEHGFIVGDEDATLALVEGYFKACSLKSLGYAPFYLQGIATLEKSVDDVAKAIVDTRRYKKNNLFFFADMDIMLSSHRRKYVVDNLINIAKMAFILLKKDNEYIYENDIKIKILIHAGKEKGVDDYMNSQIDAQDLYFYSIDVLLIRYTLTKSFNNFNQLMEVLEKIYEEDKKREYKRVDKIKISKNSRS